MDGHAQGCPHFLREVQALFTQSIFVRHSFCVFQSLNVRLTLNPNPSSENSTSRILYTLKL